MAWLSAAENCCVTIDPPKYYFYFAASLFFLVSRSCRPSQLANGMLSRCRSLKASARTRPLGCGWGQNGDAIFECFTCWLVSDQSSLLSPMIPYFNLLRVLRTLYVIVLWLAKRSFSLYSLMKEKLIKETTRWHCDISVPVGQVRMPPFGNEH